MRTVQSQDHLAEALASAYWRSLALLDLDHSTQLPARTKARAISVLVDEASRKFGADSSFTRFSRDGLAILSEVETAECWMRAESIRGAVASRKLATLSAGVAPRRKKDPSLTLWEAEAALMQAKASGRNKLVLGTESNMVMKSTYFPRALLGRLARAARTVGEPESVLLRQALEDFLRSREL